MRERRKEYENRKKELLEILETDTAYTIEVSNKILKRVREAIGLNYFQDKNFKENL